MPDTEREQPDFCLLTRAGAHCDCERCTKAMVWLQEQTAEMDRQLQRYHRHRRPDSEQGE